MIRHGIDAESAEKLLKTHKTLAALRRLPPHAIVRLHVSEAARKAIRQLDRPPIPAAILTTVLFESRHTCCVCHEAGRSIIVHHLTPWEVSHDHSPENLEVLCLNCHGEVHTTRELGRSLSASEIRQYREAWIQSVKNARTAAAFDPASWSIGVGSATWDYFNHARLIRLADELAIDTDGLEQIDGAEERRFLYSGQMGLPQAYRDFAALVRRIADVQSLVDLRTIWNRTDVLSILRPQALVAMNGHFRFRRLARDIEAGQGQMRLGYLQRRGIRFQFTFDAWETTSTSS